MGAASLVSLVSKKIIRPSIHTPSPFRSHRLSFVDQSIHMSNPFAYFYPKTNCNYNKSSYEPTYVSQLLEKSLSKALSLYYPYAGRLKDDGSSVDCNDMGVELSNVRVHCPMSEILKNPYTSAENVVFPVAQPHDHMNEGILAIAQVSYFDCGGIAVGGCLSHKIGDGCTAGNFFYNWGILSRDINARVPFLYFVGESVYPQSNDPRVISIIKSEVPEGSYLGKRFIFPSNKLDALKAKFYPFDTTGVLQYPTRTEVVSALLYKCAVAAATRSTNSFKSSALFQVANMRRRLNPPLSLDEDACGSVISGFFVKTTNEKDVNNCPSLIREMRKEKEKLGHDNKENAIISEVIDSVEKGRTPFHCNEVDNYVFTSLLSFPLYKTDFGWGKPARVSFATGPFSRFFLLMDNKSGGGIEAILTLGEQDMSIFERDPELLEFSIPAPNH